MTQFREVIEEQGLLKATADNQFEKTRLYEAAADAMDADFKEEDHYTSVNDGAEPQYKEVISKSLICTGAFSSKNWLLDLRKTFYPDSDVLTNGGRLHLELSSFNMEAK